MPTPQGAVSIFYIGRQNLTINQCVLIIKAVFNRLKIWFSWRKTLTLHKTIKLTDMTRTITIKKPSQRMIQVFDSLREKKRQQIEKLMKKKECVFTVKV